jgi:hypothetical protein
MEVTRATNTCDQFNVTILGSRRQIARLNSVIKKKSNPLIAL